MSDFCNPMGCIRSRRPRRPEPQHLQLCPHGSPAPARPAPLPSAATPTTASRTQRSRSPPGDPNSLSGESHNSGVIDWSTKKSLATGVGNNSPSIEWLSGNDQFYGVTWTGRRVRMARVRHPDRCSSREQNQSCLDTEGTRQGEGKLGVALESLQGLRDLT